MTREPWEILDVKIRIRVQIMSLKAQELWNVPMIKYHPSNTESVEESPSIGWSRVRLVCLDKRCFYDTKLLTIFKQKSSICGRMYKWPA
jgi:hypothetical protein